MSISSVGSYPYAGASMELLAAKGRQGHRCNCEEGVNDRSVKADNVDGEESVSRTEKGDHHGHERHHGHHGHGFGFGRFGMGMGHFIHEQMRTARREVAGEQLGEAATELTAKVAEVIDAAGQQDGLDAAQEAFSAAIQDVIERFDSGEIDRRRAMAGFRAAFEDLVDAVRTGDTGETPVSDGEATIANGGLPVDMAGEVTEDAGVVKAAEAEVPAGEAAEEGGNLVENLGQVFNAFMQGLRSDFAALGGMRSFMSPENRDRILETFMGLYRELAGLDAGDADVKAESAGVDQLV